jgi:hypothetical protein
MAASGSAQYGKIYALAVEKLDKSQKSESAGSNARY